MITTATTHTSADRSTNGSTPSLERSEMANLTNKPMVKTKKTASPKNADVLPRDGKSLLEAIGQVQASRDEKRRKKKKPGVALPPQLSKEPGEDE